MVVTAETSDTYEERGIHAIHPVIVLIPCKLTLAGLRAAES